MIVGRQKIGPRNGVRFIMKGFRLIKLLLNKLVYGDKRAYFCSENHNPHEFEKYCNYCTRRSR